MNKQIKQSVRQFFSMKPCSFLSTSAVAALLTVSCSDPYAYESLRSDVHHWQTPAQSYSRPASSVATQATQHTDETRPASQQNKRKGIGDLPSTPGKSALAPMIAALEEYDVWFMLYSFTVEDEDIEEARQLITKAKATTRQLPGDAFVNHPDVQSHLRNLEQSIELSIADIFIENTFR